MSAALNFLSFVIVVGSSFMCGRSWAMIRWHRRMASGWRYLHVVGMSRGTVGFIDIVVAFSIDHDYRVVRERVLAEHDKEVDQ